eukprot:CAMPEP_0197831920 /NCGR_PEP_ID=MMETSP1437-20131217/12728_1 /TAXON_ID=49252 ORGANISM="Eucampia antarctica, Strain CCMP1452" /NCGR_SAMPLE_ID=MMETSP1437 /ASSEMBLY_ACC=CAM_ASM_001096 /LENGTH=472 /DNA_ID=CAMNT_0043435053 /DNA_START=74 /DNA_END=1489 /DNA_ORIENTATION=-
MEAILPDAANTAISKAIEYVYSFEPIASQTVVLVPSFLKSQTAGMAAAIGFDQETFEYTLGLFICYPLGIIMLNLPYGKIKHLFSFFLGAFILQFVIGVQWIHHLVTVLVAYVLLLILPPKYAKTIVPAFAMLYCVLGHLHRQYINYLGWDLDFTGTQMVLTQKLYMLAYNIYDGDVLAKGGTDRASKKCEKFALQKVPGIIEYLGYTFCFTNLLAGPAYEFKTYASSCDGSNIFGKDGKPFGKIPSVVWPTLKPLFISLVCMAAFVIGNGMFPLLDPTDPQNADPTVLKEDFLEKPIYQRAAYAYLALMFIRMKYYFAWKNAEGATNIWYAGFEGFDAEGQPLGWGNANNVDILDFEFAQNVKTLSAAWNKKTANWLGKYVYIRNNGSLVATYGMSAFWHGFYPGYYMFFFSVPIMTFCERIGKKKLTPRLDDGKKWGLYGIVCWFATNSCVMYCVLGFQLLAYEWSIRAW